MPSHLRILTVAGVPVLIHRSLLVFLGAFGVYLAVTGDGWPGPLRTLAGVLGVIVSVLWHETGHALAARAAGLPVADISLHLFAGMTRMSPPRTPREEILVGIAGPAANLLVAAALLPFADGPLRLDALPDHPLLVLFLVNTLLGTANLLPAFPMDGGRLLRAGLSFAVDHRTATRVALGTGRSLALLMILAPLVVAIPLVRPALPVIGLIVLVLGERESRRAALDDEERRVVTKLASAVANDPELPPPAPDAAAPGEGSGSGPS